MLRKRNFVLTDILLKCFFFLVFVFVVLTDGLPVVNKTCDVIFPGRTGKSKGYISSPNLSVPNEDRKSGNDVTSILKNHQGPLSCTSSFVPTDAQSVTLTVSYIHSHNTILQKLNAIRSTTNFNNDYFF